jgi:glycosyltransferase involved in cell wall biosynthesis
MLDSSVHGKERASTARPDISVIICTRNRANSLKVALENLSAAHRGKMQAEVIVVDNGSDDNTKEVVNSFRDIIPLRYLYEPTPGVWGKGHALNRALTAGDLGEIIAVLDDDMTPHADWFQGVISICQRWPDKDIFAGNTYIIWPSNEVPDWAKKPKLYSWIFSAVHIGNSDALLENGRWFSGNHFWFRSRVLSGGISFKDFWNSEADFQLDLVEHGFNGVAGYDAVAGHRIQPELLQRKFVLNRARIVGRRHAWLRLRPYRHCVKQARLLHQHPWLGRLFCLLNYLRWCLLYVLSYTYPSGGTRFERRLIAVERKTTYCELLRAANLLEDYSLWRRKAPSDRRPTKPSANCSVAENK